MIFLYNLLKVKKYLPDVLNFFGFAVFRSVYLAGVPKMSHFDNILQKYKLILPVY